MLLYTSSLSIPPRVSFQIPRYLDYKMYFICVHYEVLKTKFVHIVIREQKN